MVHLVVARREELVINGSNNIYNSTSEELHKKATKMMVPELHDGCL